MGSPEVAAGCCALPLSHSWSISHQPGEEEEEEGQNCLALDHTDADAGLGVGAAGPGLPEKESS